MTQNTAQQNNLPAWLSAAQQSNNPQQQANNAPARPNPFNRPGQQQNQPNPPKPAPPQPNQPGGLRGRLGAFNSRNMQWVVKPMQDVSVRFDLTGLGDPFYRLLKSDLKLENADPQALVGALDADEALRSQLESVLEDTWQGYDFKGAALLYPWTDDVKKAFQMTEAALAAINQQSGKPDEFDGLLEEDDNSENQQQPEDHVYFALTQPLTCLRAIDVGLVINVLARVRSQVLVADTPLALETGFLERSLITEDPRLVGLAIATGYIQEPW